MKEAIMKAASELKNDLILFTRDIIAIPSLSNNEEAVIQRIKQEMERIGYENIFIDGMGNLIGQLGHGERILAIEGHVDTVDVGNLEKWNFDPYKGIIKNGIIYGRGACDMKGSIASLVYTGAILKKIGIPRGLKFLAIASVMEEIYEGLNWQYIIKENKISPDAVIIAEPSNLKIAYGQRGRVDLKIQTSGVSCHSASPEQGENAIYKIAPIILDIEEMNTTFPIDSTFGKPCISVTDIYSTAVNQNAIPDSVTIHIDRRLTPQESKTEEDVLKEIRYLKTVKTANATVYIPEYEYKSRSGSNHQIKAFYPSWYMDTSHPLIQTAIKAYQLQFNEEPELYIWPFSTNGVGCKGLFNIPTFGFGPGNEKYAHTEEDQVPIEHLIKALEFYASFAILWGNIP
ncbi:MAG: YgeY family selenium metabolism-linked hydrolase [Candidatus Heimdallarchaeota archaeon]|nr:YgeY family selenium metabolism-linked hydrolase [Candidatus Heimdallarchaeota archaeon]